MLSRAGMDVMSSPAGQFLGYPLRQLRFVIGAREIELIGPASFDALLDDPQTRERFEQDEYLPYWAEFWPASLILAEAVQRWGPAQPGNPARVLDLGCGLGLISLVAVRLGYVVTAADYEPEALEFVRENARRNGLPSPQLRVLDWRGFYPDLQFERILAVEVLYERRNLEPVATFCRNHLTADGAALICDRNRSTADEFPAVAAEAGLAVRTETAEWPEPAGGPAITGRIFHLVRT